MIAIKKKKKYLYRPPKVPWCVFIVKPLSPSQAPDNQICCYRFSFSRISRKQNQSYRGQPCAAFLSLGTAAVRFTRVAVWIRSLLIFNAGSYSTSSGHFYFLPRSPNRSPVLTTQMPFLDSPWSCTKEKCQHGFDPLARYERISCEEGHARQANKALSTELEMTSHAEGEKAERKPTSQLSLLTTKHEVRQSHSLTDGLVRISMFQGTATHLDHREGSVRYPCGTWGFRILRRFTGLNFRITEIHLIKCLWVLIQY